MIAGAFAALFAVIGARAAVGDARGVSAVYGDSGAFSANALPKAITVRTAQELPLTDVEAAEASPTAAPEASAPTAAQTSAPISTVGPYLRTQSPLVQADALIARAAFGALVPARRAPLKSERDQRAAERDAMLPEADSIDGLANNRLGPWKERLDENLGKLNEEAARYSNEVAEHRSRCAPARDEQTWQWCLTNRKRLNDWDKDLRERGEAHNAELARFHAESKPYDARVSAMVARIESWEAAIAALIHRIKQALGDEPDEKTCSDERHDELQTIVDEKCKAGGSRACKGNQDCETLRKNLARNQACLSARKKIVDECYGGKPDSGHRKAIEAEQGAVENCLDWIKKRCGGVGVGVAPL